MKIETIYNIGDKIITTDGEQFTVRGIHVYASNKTTGVQIHVGGAVFVSEKRIEKILRGGGVKSEK